MLKILGQKSKGMVSNKAFTGLASLIKLLPTGTAFLYQFLSPVVNNEGSCNLANKILASILIVVCAILCILATFTDSYKDSEGKTQYGIVTCTGLWPCSSAVDLSSYKIRFSDFVHSFFALVVFVLVALLNEDSVHCFYPSFGTTQKTLLKILPTVIGAIASAVFFFFPSKRNYIGYPASPS